MQLSTQALVIKVTDIRDNDKLLTLLTKDLGVIKAFVSGAKKIGSKNYAGTGLLCYSDFLLNKGADAYRVKESSLINSFFKIGCDINLLSLQQYFCEVAAVLSPQDMNAEEYLRLTLNCLYYLNNNKINEHIIKSIYELRILCIAGYMPDLVGCSNCGKFDDDIMFIDLLNGVMYCSNCKHLCNNTVALNKTVLSSLRHIVYSDFDRLFSFSIPDKAAKELTGITEKYLLQQTEHKFKTLDFYNSIL